MGIIKSGQSNTIQRMSKLIALGVAAQLISSCSITPKAVDNEAQLNNTYKGLHNILDLQQPMGEKVTMAEAIARTLKYNLDHKLQQAQLMIKSGNLKAAYMEMLPSLDLNVGYSFRNNDLIQNLIRDGSIVPGDQSFTPRELLTQSYGLSWSVLDLGLSYTRAQQQANRVMIAEEERRKIIQNLMQDVISSYWKAWTAQQMLGDVIRIKEKAELALQRSKEAHDKQASTPQIELGYQQTLIKAIRKINLLKSQVLDAKQTLARLMNARPNSKFELTSPNNDLMHLPDITPQFEKMDTIALVSRPELRQASYQAEIAKQGIQASVMNMLPGIDFNFGYNATNNEFMKNQNWWGGNVGTSLNLIQTVLTGPYSINLANKKHSFEQLKQVATTITVLTQVRIAYSAYLLWQEDANYAAEEASASTALFENAENLEQANQGNEQITITRGVEAISSQFDQYITMSRAHEALSKLYQAIGMDVLPPDVRNLPLKQLQAEIEKVLKAQSQGQFNQEIDKAYQNLQSVLQKVKMEMNEQRENSGNKAESLGQVKLEVKINANNKPLEKK